jgi:hypothetical protein
MDWNKFLTTEAISNYIVFIFAAIFGIIGWFIARWIGRKRPREIILIKVNESSLINIDPEVVDDVVINYKGQPIKSFYLTAFRLHNASNEVIDDVEAVIECNSADVIEAIIQDSLPNRSNSVKNNIGENSIKISLPFLNPKKTYKDTIQLKFFSLAPVKVTGVMGGGREWTVEYFDGVKFLSEISEDLSSANLVNFIGAARAILKILGVYRRIYR